MKKVFAVCLCLIPLFTLSQQFKPANLRTRIKFGSNKKTTVETIKAIGGVWDIQDSRPQYYVFTQVPFDKRSKALFTVKFTSGKAYEINYIINTPPGSNVLNLYWEIVKKISDDYGIPKSDQQLKWPCKSCAVNDIKAIKLGLVYYGAYWPAGADSIIISIDRGLHIILTVQDNKLTNEAYENQTAVN
jgi:hypothetical protein